MTQFHPRNTKVLTVWPAYVINLAQNTVRLANSIAQLGKLNIPFERIDAVDGRVLPDAEIVCVYDTDANRRRARHPLVRSEIGCYLSHIEFWRRIADGPSGGGFVFEDDFLASDDLGEVMAAIPANASGTDMQPGFHGFFLLSERLSVAIQWAHSGLAGIAEVMALLSKDRRNWDMIKLFSFDPDPKCVSRRALGPAHEIVTPYRIPSCTVGYGLTREAARCLADRSVPFFRPIDEDLKFFWETGLRVALVLPAPVTVGDQQTVTGTIGAERRAAGRTKGASRLARIYRSLLYQLRYTALLHYHRMRVRGR